MYSTLSIDPQLFREKVIVHAAEIGLDCETYRCDHHLGLVNVRVGSLGTIVFRRNFTGWILDSCKGSVERLREIAEDILKGVR